MGGICDHFPHLIARENHSDRRQPELLILNTAYLEYWIVTRNERSRLPYVSYFFYTLVHGF